MTDPTKPLGMSDFFALEAGEYLERLDGALAQTDVASADELVRLARALRGSALMANQPAIARAAAGLETLARAVREGRRAWDPATTQLAVRSVDDLKIFVRRAGAWTDADTAKAESLAQELEHLAGRPSAPVRAAEALGLDAGTRAFMAREGAAIASALDRAAQALRANPLAHDQLQQVLRALQPLRGLAAVNDLPPLPDLLEGIERAIGELSRSGIEPPANVADLFQAAATAIARSARDVAERGRPDPDGVEFRKFADLIVKFMESEPDVVSVGSLYYSDSGPHIVTRGVPVARSATLGRLELVSHGEHLRQAADSLERAPSATQRELRAHTLGTTFRALANAGGGALADRVAQFALAAREAVASGIATSDPTGFAAELRRVGDLLVRSTAGDEAAVAAELDALTAAIRALRGGAPGVPLPVVPIESLAPAAVRAATPPSPPPSPPRAQRPATDQAAPETADLVGSWAMYQRMTGAGIGPASLDELTAGASQTPPRSHPRSPALSLDTTRPVSEPATPGAAEPPLIDIRLLLYRGERALKRAQELRAAARQASGDALRVLVEEVCDLVALALEPSPSPTPTPTP
ncbi:MAG TPA: Hpt domain-containing protein [Gemmatimonadales bacterium]|nr:Hpt domain-containing protein [Gemmatimonadales bacterium]